LLSTTTNYAIRSVAYLVSVKKNGPADSTKIAEATKVPRRFLLKILHVLKRREYLTSSRGIGGGFRLAKAPNEITLYEIAAVFEDLKRFSVCPFGADGCLDSELCPLHEGWADGRDHFLEFLKRTTFECFHGVEFKNYTPRRGD
jgi:Rrf2 family protein